MEEGLLLPKVVFFHVMCIKFNFTQLLTFNEVNINIYQPLILY